MRNDAAWIGEITEALARRYSVYPARDQTHQELSQALEEFTTHLISTTELADFSPDQETIQRAEQLLEHPVFICGSMKSGTSLTTQLLDHHPNLLVLPGDSHYINDRVRWSRNDFPRVAAHWVHRLINPTGKKPFWFLGENPEQYRQFLQFLHYQLEHKPTYDILMCVVLSLELIFSSTANGSSGEPSSHTYWVEKTPHNELHVEELHRRFPKAKFIHLIRDPLNNIASLKKLTQLRGWKQTTEEYAWLLKALFEAGEKNLKRLGEDRYLILTYEELVSRPEETLETMCRFLNIPLTDTLFQPTQNGVPAMSNSMFEHGRVTGVILDQSSTTRYRDILTDQELREIVSTLYPHALHYGYPWEQPDIRRYRRSAGAQFFHRVKRLLKRKLRRSKT